MIWKKIQIALPRNWESSELYNMHKPVMFNEVEEYLNIKPGFKIIDATLNGGGHSFGLLEKFPDIKILGIEWDPDIFQEAGSKIYNSGLTDKMVAVNDSYVNLKNIVEKNDFRPDGIIFDLGVSSLHYEKSGKGFSFMRDELLDMRFNPKVNSTTAANVVNSSSQEELIKVLTDYGEEKFAKEISEGVVLSRKINPITTTVELVECIKRSVPSWYLKRKIHPATKTFQALRIAVNNELENVERGVVAAIDVVNPGGRIIVISFHGLEDKVVREIFKEKTKEGILKRVVSGTIKPKWEEVKNNPRARSAKMKICEKI